MTIKGTVTNVNFKSWLLSSTCMGESIKESYELLAKHYTLPAFDVINDQFEIETVEPSVFLLREIRRRIGERLEATIKFVEDLLHPEGSMRMMIESSMITDDEKQQALMPFFRELNKWFRQSLQISCNDEKEAAYIVMLTEQWPEVHRKLSGLAGKLSESWDKKHVVSANQGYIG